jgi:leader peptidase (prepilin peptidase)/N-methyltransferase
MLASLSGALVGLGLKFAHRLGDDGYVPFGPFLALAGCVVAVVGIDAIALWMGWSVY